MDSFEKEGILRRNAIWLVVFVALVIFGFLLFKGWNKIINDEIDGMITIAGNFSCLPLKTKTKTEVLSLEEKCTLGVRSRDGLYYALDISHIQDANTDLKAEDMIAVTGTLKPSSFATSSDWAEYDVKGIILVNTLLRTR